MGEREQIFRERLIALMSELKDNAGSDRRLRQLVGAYANKMSRDAGTRNWADLKLRADGPTYDSMLRLFQHESERASKADDPRGVRACEVLAISLIARRQYQADLLPGVALLDKFIEGSEKIAQRTRSQFIPIHRTAKP